MEGKGRRKVRENTGQVEGKGGKWRKGGGVERGKRINREWRGRTWNGQPRVEYSI